MGNYRELNITDQIAEGDIDNIIKLLTELRKSGFNKLFFDGYHGSIYLYKNPDIDQTLNPDVPVFSLLNQGIQ